MPVLRGNLRPNSFTPPEGHDLFEDLAYECPLGSLEDYARHNDFSQEVRDGMDKLTEAASFLHFEGQEIIAAFAKEAGMWDEINARAQARWESR